MAVEPVTSVNSSVTVRRVSRSAAAATGVPHSRQKLALPGSSDPHVTHTSVGGDVPVMLGS